MTSASFDPAKELKIYLRINRDGQLTFAFYDSEDDDFPLDDYTVVWNIYKREGDTDPFLQLTEASGLTKSTSAIAATITKAQAAKFRDQTYFHELIRMHAVTGEKTWLAGDFVAHNGKFDGLTTESGSSSVTVTINDGDSVVNITISDSAPASGGGGGSGWGLTGNTTLTGNVEIWGGGYNLTIGFNTADPESQIPILSLRASTTALLQVVDETLFGSEIDMELDTIYLGNNTEVAGSNSSVRTMIIFGGNQGAGTTQAGFGYSIDHRLVNTDFNHPAVSKQIIRYTDPTAGSEDAEHAISVIGGGTLVEGLVVAPDAVYLGPPETNGTWRFLKSGDNLLLQQREAGVYVTKQTFSGA
jgi:hypothetical protein